MFHKAANGCVPKGNFEVVGVEKSIALLILKSERVVKIAQRTSGGPGVRASKRSPLFQVPRFYGSSGLQNFATTRHSVTSFLRVIAVPTERCAWQFAYDSVATEKRLRYDTSGGSKLGGLKGAACESTYDGALTIKSYAHLLPRACFYPLVMSEFFLFFLVSAKLIELSGHMETR